MDLSIEKKKNNNNNKNTKPNQNTESFAKHPSAAMSEEKHLPFAGYLKDLKRLYGFRTREEEA